MSAPRAPRLDPLALPPATTGRFLLLLATAVASSAYVYAWLVERLQIVSDAPGQCVQLARANQPRLTARALVDWYGDCVVWASLQQATVVISMVVIFAVATGAIFLALPRLLTRRLKPLASYVDHRDIGHVARQVLTFVGEERGRKTIDVYVDEEYGRGADRAFGRFGRYRIALDIGSLGQAASNPDDPRLWSILRHEIAHIRNRDIDLTYLAIASWWGFLLAVALPFVVVAVNAPSQLWSFSWRLAILLALLWLVRAALLRSREFYADVRSAQTADHEQALVATMDAVARGRPTRAARWLGFLRYHPEPLHRLGVLHSGRRMFMLSPGTAAATGALVGLAYPPASLLLSLTLPDRLYERGWVVGLVFGGLVAAAMTGSVWRAALWGAVHADQRAVRALPAAGAFTAGLLLAQLTTPRLPVGGWGEVFLRSPPVALALGALLFLLGYVYLRWTLLCAGNWLPVVGSPRGAYRFGVVQSGLVVGVWLAAWFQMVELMVGGRATWTMLVVVLVIAVANPVTVLSIGWACGYALATWQTKRMRDRSRKRRWWRVHDGTAPVLPGVRPPLGVVYLGAAAIVGGYYLAVLPFYPDLRAALVFRNDLLDAPMSAVWPILRIVGYPALAVVVAASLGLGLLVGGRRRTGQAVATAGACLLLSAVGLQFVMLVHLTRAYPFLPDVFTLLSGLSHLELGADLPGNRPRNAALGLLVLALLCAALVAGIPAAILGSAIRALATRRRPVAPPERRRPPGRPLWAAVVLALPLVALWAGLGYLAWTEWRVSDSVVVDDSVDFRAVEQVLKLPWPTVALEQACTGIVELLVGTDLADVTASGDLVLVMAHTALYALHSDDATLRTFGEDIADSLRTSAIRQAARGVAAAAHYCVTAVNFAPTSAAGG